MMEFYSLDADTTFSMALASKLGVTLTPHEKRRFEDGEYKLRPLHDPLGADAYVVHSI